MTTAQQHVALYDHVGEEGYRSVGRRAEGQVVDRLGVIHGRRRGEYEIPGLEQLEVGCAAPYLTRWLRLVVIVRLGRRRRGGDESPAEFRRLAHDDPLERQRRAARPHAVEHIREVSGVPHLTRYGEGVYRQPLAFRDVRQRVVDVVESRLAGPAEEGRQYRRRPSPSGEAVDHGDVAIVGLEPAFHRQ